jgi:hypothetical protein
VTLAGQYGRYGYRRITAFLVMAGWKVGKDRVERIWRREGLKVPKKQKPRGRLWLNDGSCVRLRPTHRNHVWSYDFVSVRTHDGRTAPFSNQPSGETLKLANDRAELLDLRVGFVFRSAGHDADDNELLADIDAGASLQNRFDHLLLQCGQAAGGDLGILFYGLRRGTSQVYVSRRRVRLSFGVEPPISPRPFTCSHLKSPSNRVRRSTGTPSHPQVRPHRGHR